MATSEEFGGLTVERYAEISAYMRHYPATQQGRVLAFFGLGGADWEEASTEWARVLEEEIDAGNTTTVIRFGDQYSKTRRTLKAEAPQLDADVARKFVSVDETSLLMPAIDLDFDDPLPFESSEGRRSPPPLSDLTASPDRGATGFMPVLQVDDVSATPFSGPPARSMSADQLRGRFQLAQYAMLRAELDTRREERRVVLERHQLDESMLTALDAAWVEAFQADNATKEAFEQLFKRLRGHSSPLGR